MDFPMHPIVERILADKRKEVKGLRERGLPRDLHDPIPPFRDFKAAISKHGGIHLIGEIKFASPSKGTIRARGDPVSIARQYEEAGAAAVSVVTEERYFKGDIRYIPAIRRAISLPVLRKDFILDPVQVAESAAYGADAVLLIVEILTVERLGRLLNLAAEWGIACLTEVHNPRELEMAVACGADIIGINNRDFHTFRVDRGTSLRLAPLIPHWCVGVSESGISGGEDIAMLRGSGIGAVLVGTSLMSSEDVGAKARELVAAGKDHDAG